MRFITNRRLPESSSVHHDAGGPLQAWRKAMETTCFSGFAELREVFRSVDKVGALRVFNIAGNKYCLITFLNFDRQLCYIKQILTHTKYGKGARCRW
ncbi:MAG: hypothetical protein A3H99_05070 [Gallionellales bacterium RIFCSPLOWO2_02_FULL_59_110]|nr:MAG: hypothetical protein A3H99_05070 [Gallionellales bacterium RIFCSPLOWO2_02_FULL_59_110]OGT04389.1 MAG: hypothetical protein A2Z65_06440 [Gallionellales bacterium RIFCSPLOWO2_02_58_13]